MTDEWTTLLSDYLNGDLEPADHGALETHLNHCAECTKTLEELRGVVSWATSHPGLPPRADVWPSIATAIRASRGRERTVGRAAKVAGRGSWLSMTMPQALAAGIALTVVAGGSWWASRRTLPAPVVQEITVAAWTPTTGPYGESTILAAQKYSTAIAELEQALVANDSRIDTSTVRIVQGQLALIDRAIDEARAALARDPNSDYLADHFANMMRKKLALLRTVARS